MFDFVGAFNAELTNNKDYKKALQVLKNADRQDIEEVSDILIEQYFPFLLENASAQIFIEAINIPGIREFIGEEKGNSRPNNCLLQRAIELGKTEQLNALLNLPNVIETLNKNRKACPLTNEGSIWHEPFYNAIKISPKPVEALQVLLNHASSQNMTDHLRDTIEKSAVELGCPNIIVLLSMHGFDFKHYKKTISERCKQNPGLYDAIYTAPAIVDDIFKEDNVQNNLPKNGDLLYAKDVCRSLVQANAKQPLGQILSYLPMMQGPRDNKTGESFAEQRINESNARMNRP